MGVKFSVKPTPLNVEEVDEQRREMLLSWYEKNEPEVHKKLNDGVSIEEYTVGDAEKLGGWKKDVEFRKGYLKFWAESCMEFHSKLDDSVWESNEIPLSTISEAWDFFTERRLVPINGVQAR